MWRWLHYSNSAEDCDGTVVSRETEDSHFLFIMKVA
jgi:hypothetical protein